MSLPLPLLECLADTRVCSVEHAAEAAPTSWAQLIQRLTTDAAAARARAEAEPHWETTAQLRARQHDVVALLADCDPAARERALGLLTDQYWQSIDLAAVAAVVLLDRRGS